VAILMKKADQVNVNSVAKRHFLSPRKSDLT